MAEITNEKLDETKVDFDVRELNWKYYMRNAVAGTRPRPRFIL